MSHDVLLELGDELNALLGKASMPELVAALVLLSRAYAEHQKSEGNGEYQGWAVWDRELSEALLRAVGEDEFKELIPD